MNKIFKGFIGVALLGASSLALAVPTTGGISFSSIDGTPFSFNTSTNTFDFADGVNAEVDSRAGSFANYFADGDLATFFDFAYDPFVGPQTIWSSVASVGTNAGTTISFALESANVLFESNTLVLLDGLGTISDGTNTIDGQWNISANSAGGSFSWSASTAVPEPGTLALLGLGLAGLGVARRRQKA